MTTFDFQDGKGPVPAHQHSNGGGWVADTASVADKAHVGPDAKVYGDAWVSGNAWVSGDAKVSGNAEVSGNAWVSGNAEVYGDAKVYGYARVYGYAKVYGDAKVSGNAKVYNNAIVTDILLTANRSDDYTFSIFKCQDGLIRVTAGCRYFTISEAIDHWTKTRGDTKLGKESINIIGYLRTQFELVSGDE